MKSKARVAKFIVDALDFEDELWEGDDDEVEASTVGLAEDDDTVVVLKFLVHGKWYCYRARVEENTFLL